MPTWSGLDNYVYGKDHSLQFTTSSPENRLSIVTRPQGMRKIVELLQTLIGASAGSTALDTYKRVKAAGGPEDTMKNSGVVNVESVEIINRATTAQDVTDLKAIIGRHITSVYPGDLSGNVVGRGDPRFIY